jgi:ribonuclease P protein component
MERLKKRADFLAAAKGRRTGARSFTLQSLDRREADPAAARVGLTVSKKVGGAVERNRIKRRLREALRRSLPLVGRPGFDYVVLARREVLGLPFDALVDELVGAFARTHGASRAPIA